MKRSVDSYLSTTTQPYIPQGSSRIEQLPLELPLQIFSHLSQEMLRQISSVSKTFYKIASDDSLWEPIAKRILIQEELDTKSSETSYKDFCLNMLIPTQMQLAPTITLLPRNPEFVDKIKQMQLPNYKLLTPRELATVFDETNLSDLIEEVNKSERVDIRYAAVQNYGNKKYHFINCTDEVLSITAKGNLYINNHNMLAWMGGINYAQIFIYSSNDILHIYYTKEYDLMPEVYYMPIYVYKCKPNTKAGPGCFQIKELFASSEDEDSLSSNDVNGSDEEI